MVRVTPDVPVLVFRPTSVAGRRPAWIGVGANDLFHGEDVAYARRLREAGVACTLHEVPGAHHGFDAVERNAAVSRAFVAVRVAALADVLGDG